MTALHKQIGVAALYALLMFLDDRYFEGGGTLTSFEPASGLAMAVLLIGGMRYAWSVLIGAVLINTMETPLWVAAVTSLADTLEALCAAWLLMRAGKFDPALRSLRDYLRLLAFGGVSAGVAGGIWATALLASGFITYEAYLHKWAEWWLGDMLGITLVAPLILVCWRPEGGWLKTNQMPEFLLSLCLMLLAGQIAFFGWFHDSLGNLSQGYVMFLFIIWVAVRLGTPGTVVAMNMIAIQAMLGSLSAHGYFSHDAAQAHPANYWLYMMALSVVGMALATFFAARKQAEDALRRSETKFRTLYDSIGDAVHLMDETGFIDCNKATLAMCGCATKEEFCSKSPVDFSPPEQPCGTNSVALTERYIATAMENGSHRFDWVCKRFDNGKLFNIDVQLTAMKLDGKPVFLVVARDITERKTAEAALRQSELKFRTLFESTNDAVMLLNEKGFFDCNKATLEMIGCATKEEFCSKHPADLSPPEQPCGTSSFVLANQHIAAAMREGSRRFEWVSKRVDTGRIFIADVLLSALELEGDLVLQVVIRDITEQKRAIEEFERFFNLVPDMACIASTDGYFKKINPAWQKTLGYTEQELLSAPFLDFVHPDDRETTVREVERLAAGERAIQFNNRYRGKDGSYRWLEWDTAPVAGSTQLFASARDITARKKAEEALSESENMLRQAQSIARIGHFKFNPASGTVEGSDELFNIFGLCREQFKFSDFVDSVHPDDRDLDVAAIESAIRSKAGYEIEHRLLLRDGTLKWVRAVGQFIAASPEEQSLLVGTVQDITGYKQVEEDLRESKARLRAYLDNISDTVWVVRENLDITYVSSGVTRLMGILPEESIGRPSAMYIHPDDMGAIGNAMQYLMKHPGEPRTAQYRVKHKDGRWIPVESTGINLLDNPAINGVLVAMRDITERKHIEDELRLTKERYDFATAIGKVGTWDWNPGTGVLVWSDETFRLMGFAPGSVTPSYELYLSLVHPDDRAALDSAVQAALHDRKPYDLDCRIVLGGGKGLVCHVTGYVEFDAANQPTRMLGTIQDITGRKQAEIALRESEERLRGIMDNAPAVIFLKDTAGRYLLVNSRYEKLFHISNEAVQGKTDYDIFPQHLADIFFESDKKVIRSGQPLEAEEQVPQDDGIHTYISVKFPLREASGQIYAVCGIATDITERKAAEQQLHNLSAHILDVREEEKASIAREIHDELGGTLTALNIDAYWLARKLSSLDNAAALVGRAKSMAQRIDGAVNATRRIIDDMRPAVLDDLGLLAAIEWLATDFQMRTGIECRVKCIEDEVNLGKQRSIALFRIFQEALTNVSRHSGASEVEIEYFNSENEAVLTVSDNGCGIPENHVASPKSYGMLGMKERAGQLGGKIVFGSPPSGGFSLKVTLPLPAGERDAP